jgi:hypothetical protein
VLHLQKSSDEHIRGWAFGHPQIPLKQLDLSRYKLDSELSYIYRDDPKDWLELSKTFTSTLFRAYAHRQYGEAMNKPKLASH